MGIKIDNSTNTLQIGDDAHIVFDEHATAPATPTTGNVCMYAKQDGFLYSVDDLGVETLLGGLAVTANQIVVGSGSNVTSSAEFTFDSTTSILSAPTIYQPGRGSTIVNSGAYVVRAFTEDATQTEMFLGTDVSDTPARLTVPTDYSWSFNVIVVARRADGDDETAGYELRGVIDNNAGITAIVGAVTKNVLAEDTVAWDVTAEADDTNDALVIKVTGEASKQIRWAAFVRTIETEGLAVAPPAPTAGLLFAWGLGTGGQLGDGTAVSKSSPVAIGALSWTAISAGVSHTLGIRSDGTLWAWGNNTFGQLGDITAVAKSSPVALGALSWTAVAAGAQHSVAIRNDGGLFTWGRGVFGQLGDNTTGNRSSPVQIGAESWTAIASGSHHVAAVRLDGGLFTWGFNSSGMLGDGTTANKSSPVQIGASSWTIVSAADATTGGITSAGSLFMWGNGGNGQLGEGVAASRSSPVGVSGGGIWSTVSAAAFHTVGLKTDSTIYSWGINNDGQLGQNDTASRSSPTQIGASTWDAIATNNPGSGVLGHCIAIRSDGTLWSWGRNGSGQMGDGTVINKSSPVQVGALTSWVRLEAGEEYSLAVRT